MTSYTIISMVCMAILAAILAAGYATQRRRANQLRQERDMAASACTQARNERRARANELATLARALDLAKPRPLSQEVEEAIARADAYGPPLPAEHLRGSAVTAADRWLLARALNEERSRC